MLSPETLKHKNKSSHLQKQQPGEAQLASFFPLPLLEHCHPSPVAKAKTSEPNIFKIKKIFCLRREPSGP